MRGPQTRPQTAGSEEMIARGNNDNGGVRELRRWLVEFVVVLALFWVAVFAVNGSDIRAHAISLPAIAESILLDAAAPNHVGPQADQVRHVVHSTAKTKVGGAQELILLSLAFAAIVACNLAFWRHLRRVYASPRRSVWRRGRTGSAELPSPPPIPSSTLPPICSI